MLSLRAPSRVLRGELASRRHLGDVYGTLRFIMVGKVTVDAVKGAVDRLIAG